MPPQRIPLQGVRFGKWVVGDFSHINSSRSAYWNVTCDCGNTNIVSTQSLRKGQSTQCRPCSSKSKTAIYNKGNKLKYLYIFKLNEYYKIGVSNEPEVRFKHIERNSPYRLEIIGIYNNTYDLERSIHLKYEHSRIKGEWFALSLENLAHLTQTLACSAGGCEI